MKVKAVKVNRAHYFLTDPRIYMTENCVGFLRKNMIVVETDSAGSKGDTEKNSPKFET